MQLLGADLSVFIYQIELARWLKYETVMKSHEDQQQYPIAACPKRHHTVGIELFFGNLSQTRLMDE